MLKGHLPRVMHHQVYQYTKFNAGPGGRLPGNFFFFITLGLELSEKKVYEP